MQLTEEQARSLLAACANEVNRAPGYKFFVELDLVTAIQMIGSLQLALRHPSNTGPAAATTRQIIELMVARLREDGFTAHARLADLGNKQEYDA